MKIVVISEGLAPPWDDGVGKFTGSVGRALEKDHDVRLINVDCGGTGGSGETIRRVPGARTFMTPSLRREIRSFSPDAVLYVPSPSSTIGSFARSYSLRRHAPAAAHGMVALIPRRHSFAARPFLRGTAPDVLFVSSRRSLLHALLLSLRGELLPVGVDATEFRPPRPDERRSLREKYGISAGSYVYLHVGPLDERLRLSSLTGLADQPGASVVVVAGSVAPPHDGVQTVLEGAGVRVVCDGVPAHEFYRVADCYVYPVDDHQDRTELPTSVFEALASGLPVVGTPVGGLRDFLPPGDDLRYVENVPDLLAAVARMREHAAPAVRAMDRFSWTRVAGRVVDALGAGRRRQ